MQEYVGADRLYVETLCVCVCLSQASFGDYSSVKWGRLDNWGQKLIFGSLNIPCKTNVKF